MANYATLKAAIQQVVKTNGNNEITGALLQQSLLAMINALGDGFQYMGIATPATNPGTPDQNVFYIASTAGNYSNFGSIVLSLNEVAILKYNGTWVKDVTGFATAEQVAAFNDTIQTINDIFEITGTTVSRSIIDYTPGGTAALVGTYYWAAIASKTMPDRDKNGILKEIKVVTAPSEETNFSIKLFRKVWQNGEIVSFQEIPNSQHSFTFPAGSTILNVSASNIIIEKDVIIEINGLAKYNRVGNCFAITGDNFNTSFEGVFNLSVDYVVDFVEYDSERLKEIEEKVSDVEETKQKANLALTKSTNAENAVSEISDVLDMQPATVVESIIDYTPDGQALLSGNDYWGVLHSNTMPDRTKNGILAKITIGTAPTENKSFGIRLVRKIWQNGIITGFNIIPGGEYSFTFPAGQTELDVSASNIVIEPDVIILSSKIARYRSIVLPGTDNYCILNDHFYDAFSGHFCLDINYFVQFETKKSERLDNLDELINSPILPIFNKLNQTNIVVLGDSITWLGGDDCNGRQTPSRGWTTYFKNEIKPNSIRSYARSGATWSHTANTVYDITENTGILSDNNVIYNQINRLIADTGNPAPDIIIIAAGTNDAWYPGARPDALSVTAETEFADTSGYITNQAVGTLTSIAAAMRYDIELLKTNYPNCQIYVTTPLQSTAFTLARCFDVGKIIKDCAKYLSIECIDQAEQAGIYRAQENVSNLFTYDGTHTSAIGAKMVGQFLAKTVLCSYRNFLVDEQ